ncbi:TldD/PmbA family protein [Paracoccus sp. DMF-8]|uniref:TldD/PmbA family protein n=1 Tax=Paracoccus sp. DMF-8 TaxID=3019445 RepID=UPI0023E3E3A1|nr:TldD/PmbA family protein [Paracoccus sp. DMF-8]MDF3607298.1 TldD/PmbA family protein [Paracoccus sp. DMF-8]
MNGSDDLQRLTGALLDMARRAGADQADAVAVRGAALSVDVREGRLEHAERAEAVDIGLRVLVSGRQASVSASDHSDRAIAEMAERAVAMAREAPVDDNLGLADPGQLARDTDSRPLELRDDSPAPTAEDLRDIALRAETAALSVQGITRIESASASASSRMMWLQASNGFSAGYARSGHAISTIAIGGEGLGMERDWSGESRSHRSDLPSPEFIGRQAAERTLQRLGAKKPPTGSFPILYDQRVSSGLIGHLLSAVNGSAIARGASWLRNDLGQQVLPAGIDLREDPHLLRMSSSRIFDGEGLPTAPRLIVGDGVLMGWTLDLATGRKLGMASTANAARGTSAPPSPAVTNITMTAGTATPQELIAQMGRGLVVTSMLGASINANTGDWSRGAAGFWVENGEIAWPVNECTIAGNLRDMLMRVTVVSDTPEWRAHAVPSLLVEGMTVAGN